MSSSKFPNCFYLPSNLDSMSLRRSGRKKNITPEVVDSDNEDFEVVASDDLCVVYCHLFS